MPSPAPPESRAADARRPVRPLPQGDDFFEIVWRQYRENQNIF